MNDSVVYGLPPYFTWIFGLLLLAGAIGWLTATVIGFARARATGASTRWFALTAVCLLLYHAHWLTLVLSIPSGNNTLIFGVLTSLNVFVVLGAICAIIGFVRLSRGQ